MAAPHPASEPPGDYFRSWCYNEPLLLDPAQLNQLLNSLAMDKHLNPLAAQALTQTVLSEEQLARFRLQAHDQLTAEGEPRTKSSVRERAGELAAQNALEELVRRGMLEQKPGGDYVPNHKALSEYLARLAFLDAEQHLKGRKLSPRGKHKTQLKGIERIIHDQVVRTPRAASSLSIPQTLKNSLVRRATDPAGPLLAEEDLARHRTRKEDVPYHVVMLIDISGSMTLQKLEGAIAAALSLGYYMRTKHKKDTLDILAFDDITRYVKFERLPFLRAGAGTATDRALYHARELFQMERRREKLLYLLTDGYPTPDWRIPKAIDEAKRLRKDGVQMIEILLGDDDPAAVKAGKAIAQAAGGTLFHVQDPAQLGAFYLEQYALAKGRKRL
jgi:uncharacterized protein with von Willebrand factor type A (vWA) domain